MIEATFSAYHKYFAQFFTARTFTDVVQKGEYEPYFRGTMVAEQLMKALTYVTCDFINVKKAKGPFGQTPHDAALRLIKDGAFVPVPTADHLRIGFGTELALPLTREGVRWNNISYTNKPLAAYFANNGPKKSMRVVADAFNVGRVSVMLDDRWTTVAGPANLDGVAVSQWEAACRDAARQYGEEAQVHFPIMMEVVRRLAAMGEDAEQAAGLNDIYMTRERMVALTRQARLHVVYDNKPSEHAAGTSASSAGKRFSVTAPANVEPAPDAANLPARRWSVRQPKAE